MQAPKIMWVDDEIDLLKPQILFLEKKGMTVVPVANGEDAVDLAGKEEFDIVFLDENMPGMNGLETLSHIKAIRPHLPIIMITKSEEEHLMDGAIGSRIADYLIKPVNPNQIVLAIKKVLDAQTIVGRKVLQDYQRAFTDISRAFMDDLSTQEWIETYKILTYWEMELDHVQDNSMKEVFHTQKVEANINFSKFVSNNYLDWVKGGNDAPLLSPNVLKQNVFPLVKPGEHSVFFLLIDCLRYDQWKIFEPIISQFYTVQSESAYYSILPTATQYARNAIFAGMFPIDIADKFPKYWVSDDEEGGKNLYEADFLKENILRNKLNVKHSYHKVITVDDGQQLADNALNLLHNDLNVVVVNFIDLLSHARSEMNIIKELAPDEAALRSLTKSWFEHSALLTFFKKLKDHKVKLVITSDHGTIRVKRPIKIIGDRHTTTNLRYKQGRNLNYDEKSRQIFSVKNPVHARLPKSTVSGTYAFASEDCFFVYPNNYNYYANFYKDTFQHGGISLEEMIVPLITLTPRN